MVMDRTAEAFHVVLDGRTVAHLFQQGDFTWLEWQQGYWQDPHRPILGLRFENEPEGRIASALKLPPWFSNLLPEGQLRDWVARSAGVSSQREIMLLRRLGRDLPGGVMIEAVQRLVNPKWEPDEFVVQQGRGAVEIAQRPRFSLAGVALKFSMVQRGERLTLPSHLEDGNWIVKLPDSTYSNVPQNEFATMALARSLGITTPRFRLLERDELPPLPENVWPNGQSMAYAIERFDRRPGGRIHMEDLAQVKGVYPHNKYEGSFETAAALVYRGMDFESGLEFVRRLFFSFMVGNGDMHLKNTTLLYSDPRRPTISPAYDLVCTAPYQYPDDEDLGLKLGGSRRFEAVSLNSFKFLCDRIGMPSSEVLVEINRMATEFPEKFAESEHLWSQLPDHQKWLKSRIGRLSPLFDC